MNHEPTWDEAADAQTYCNPGPCTSNGDPRKEAHEQSCKNWGVYIRELRSSRVKEEEALGNELLASSPHIWRLLEQHRHAVLASLNVHHTSDELSDVLRRALLSMIVDMPLTETDVYDIRAKIFQQWCRHHRIYRPDKQDALWREIHHECQLIINDLEASGLIDFSIIS